MSAALNPATYSSAQLIVTFVGLLLSSRFLLRFADFLFDKMLPSIGRDSVTRAEIKELEKSMAVMRGILLLMAGKMDVDMKDLQGLVE